MHNGADDKSTSNQDRRPWGLRQPKVCCYGFFPKVRSRRKENTQGESGEPGVEGRQGRCHRQREVCDLNRSVRPVWTGHGVGAFTLRGDVLNASLAVAQHLFILSAQRSYCGVFVFDSGLPTCVELAFDKSLSRVSPLCCLLISNSLTLFFIKCRKDIYSTASRFFKILARVRKHWSCVINTCF